MSLIKSISGIRGTIGGKSGDGLTPLDIVKFTSAYATFMRRNSPVKTNVIVVGRDARLSGRMVLNTVVGTLTVCVVTAFASPAGTAPLLRMTSLASNSPLRL